MSRLKIEKSLDKILYVIVSIRSYLHLKWSTQHKQQLLMLQVFFIQCTPLYSLLTTHVANNFPSQARLLHSNSVH